jgi:hypothetical protein
LFRAIGRLLAILKALGVDPPIMIMLGLIGVLGYTLTSHDYVVGLAAAPFDRDVLMPQEVLLDSYSADVSLAMKPMADELWNAADRQASPYYKGGKWIGEELARQRRF